MGSFNLWKTISHPGSIIPNKEIAKNTETVESCAGDIGLPIYFANPPPLGRILGLVPLDVCLQPAAAEPQRRHG